MSNFRGARAPEREGIPVHALDEQLFSIVGVATEEILAPSGRRVIMFKFEGAGVGRIKLGPTTDLLAAPSETDQAVGDQSLPIAATDGIVAFYFPMDTVLSVAVEGAGQLVYWFVP